MIQHSSSRDVTDDEDVGDTTLTMTAARQVTHYLRKEGHVSSRNSSFQHFSLRLALQYMVLPCNKLPCLAIHCLALLHIVLPCCTLPCLAVHCLTLQWIALPCSTVPCLAVHCLTLQWIALPCSTLPCLALLYIALPCSTLPCLSMQSPHTQAIEDQLTSSLDLRVPIQNRSAESFKNQLQRRCSSRELSSCRGSSLERSPKSMNGTVAFP